jgi:hypothetical protein
MSPQLSTGKQTNILILLFIFGLRLRLVKHPFLVNFFGKASIFTGFKLIGIVLDYKLRGVSTGGRELPPKKIDPQVVLE